MTAYTDTGRKCSTCIFFEQHIQSGHLYLTPPPGFCMRYPPNALGDYSKVLDSEENWCGEWKGYTNETSTD